MTVHPIGLRAPSANTWPITIRVRTRDGRLIDTTWINSPDLAPEEEQVRAVFFREVARHGGSVAAIELAKAEEEHPLSRTVRRYRADGRAPVAMEG